MLSQKLTSPKLLIPLFIVFLIIFSNVAYGVITPGSIVNRWDIKNLNWLTNRVGEPPRDYSQGWFNDYLTFWANLGDVRGVLWISLAIVIIVFFYRKHLAVWLTLLLSSGTILNALIKQTIERARPYNHLAIDTGFSFPSGHSNAITLLYLCLMIVIGSLGVKLVTKICCGIIMGLMWLSVLFGRVYFHAHYLSDVIGGVSLGVIWVVLFLAVYPLFTKRQQASTRI